MAPNCITARHEWTPTMHLHDDSTIPRGPRFRERQGVREGRDIGDGLGGVGMWLDRTGNWRKERGRKATATFSFVLSLTSQQANRPNAWVSCSVTQWTGVLKIVVKDNMGDRAFTLPLVMRSIIYAIWKVRLIISHLSRGSIQVVCRVLWSMKNTLPSLSVAISHPGGSGWSIDIKSTEIATQSKQP